jgi:hypothetical protein
MVGAPGTQVKSKPRTLEYPHEPLFEPGFRSLLREQPGCVHSRAFLTQGSFGW